MKNKLIIVFIVIAIFTSNLTVFSKEKKPLDLQTMLEWKSIRGTALSDNGGWMAYYLAPAEGNSTLIIRSTKNKKEYKFKAGKTGFVRAGKDIAFSGEKWLVFIKYPEKNEIKKAKKTKKPARKKLVLVNLIDGKDIEFKDVSSFSLNGDLAQWLAMKKYSSKKPGKDSPKGKDVILRNLSNETEFNIGNVSEYKFNKSGKMLALTIDAQDQSGNGVWLRNMRSGSLTVLDSGKAFYEKLNWTKRGDAFTVLKGKKNKDYKNKFYQVLGFRVTKKNKTLKTVFDPEKIKGIPKDWTVSVNRNPSWAKTLNGFSFGIQDAELTDKAKEKRKKEKEKKEKKDKEKEKKEKEKKKKGSKNAKNDEPLPKMVIWHWKDKRLQSKQWKQASRDKKFSFICFYDIKTKKFTRIAEKKYRSINITNNGKYALLSDNHKYKLLGNMDGRRYTDIIIMDLKTGKKKVVLEKIRWFFGLNPSNTHFVFYKDKHYHSYNIMSGKKTNMTKKSPTSFVNTEDDHWVIDLPIFHRGFLKKSQGILLYDNWDLWKVSFNGKGVNLTLNGKKKQIRFQRLYRLYPDDEGIDLSKPQYCRTYSEWTKKRGIVRFNKGKPGPKQLFWDDAQFMRLMKAKKAELFLYTYETNNKYPDYYIAGSNLKNGKKLTDANPQQKNYLWSSGVKLVNYTNSKGKKLQGTLYLPANYEKGKKYPTMIYMYEKLSQNKNRYRSPRAYGYDHSLFLSNGYAVLNPDIVFELNDPGKSAVDCIIACLDAAVKTGVVDNDRVGINGWSWGGYITAFTVTQSKRFKAAFAAASLTNMISMYSSIYWNVGGSNMAIFESSQGRFKGGFWDNMDAYKRNSPVFHAQNVQTPLLLLQNDKDGAVDYNQGIEYFNTLRRQSKEVVMLEYKGENHGLRKVENQRDLCVRVKEFFDHYLKDKKAPEWWTKGVDYIKLKKHLKDRAKLVKPKQKKKPEDAKSKDKNKDKKKKMKKKEDKKK